MARDRWYGIHIEDIVGIGRMARNMDMESRFVLRLSRMSWHWLLREVYGNKIGKRRIISQRNS